MSTEQVLGGVVSRVIDLRSPAEFAEDHIPGARNVPLFDDFQRSVIGTLYKQRSPDAAFAEGWARTVERIEGLVGAVAEHVGWTVPAVDLRARVDGMCAGGIEGLEGAAVVEPMAVVPDDAVVFHCWRGGLRSRSVVGLMRSLGLERAVGLIGGYKAYRASVVRALERWQAPPTFVLRGLTGVGKTLVLHHIEALRPGWTVDLEGLAGHRGSILGMVGLQPCSQKTFDSRLAARLRRGFDGLSVMEGESRKVGDTTLPRSIWSALDGGTSLEIVASKARRVQVLIEDYLVDASSRGELAQQLPFLEQRLGRTRWRGVLVGMLEAGRDEELVELLLERYYDPRYRRSERGRHCGRVVRADDPAAAADEIVTWLEAQAVPARGRG